jgi:hypothetical protein
VIFFAWLANQGRIWTTDRLAKRKWPNCGFYHLCKQCTRTIDHLFVHCCFTTRLCDLVKDWMGLNELLQSCYCVTMSGIAEELWSVCPRHFSWITYWLFLSSVDTLPWTQSAGQCIFLSSRLFLASVSFITKGLAKLLLLHSLL